MNSVQLKAIEFNNHAASLIEAGNNSKNVICVLTTALKTVQQTMNEDDENMSSPPSKENCLDGCMELSPLQHISTDEAESDEPSCNIYMRPIHLPNSMATCSYGSSLKISVVIMFNLALAHHLDATANEGVTPAIRYSTLKKAAKMYELAFMLQRELSNESNNVMFTMATANNLGLVYQSLGEGVAAKKCFEHLLSTLMFVIDCGGAGESILSKYHGSFFFRTVSHLITRPQCTAAAA